MTKQFIIKLMLSLLLVIGFQSNSKAQSKAVADKYYSEFSFAKAAKLYEDMIKKGDSSKVNLERAGDSYYKIGNTQNSEKWYALLVKKYANADLAPEYYFKYAQSLRANNNVEKAAVWATKYYSQTSNPEGLSQFLSNTMDPESVQKLYSNIKGISINTPYSDFTGCIKDGKLYWYSGNPDASGSKKYNWNQESFLDIFAGNINNDDPSQISDQSNALGDINSKYHDATIAITKDGQTMYFTRDDSKGVLVKEGKTKIRVSHLKLFKATKQGNSWGNVTELPFNNDSYSVGHPALSPKGDQLYFVSNMPGSLGGTDIYKVSINTDGTFGTPVNLGKQINTAGNEMFPFIDNKGVLYFSSNGYSGLGLLDIYEATFANGQVKIKNLGPVINSDKDDFGFVINSDDTFGYFSSNKPGGVGDDDIYSFNIGKVMHIAKGIIRDEKTKEGIPGVNIRIFDIDGNLLKSIVTAADGSYMLDGLAGNQTVVVTAEKENYRDAKTTIVLDGNSSGNIETNISMTNLIVDNEIVINPIYFDLNKFDIRADAAYELEQIVGVMEKNPNMTIAIESHTDSQGNDKQNLILSDKRAKSTSEYLYFRGIDKKRIVSVKGYGETKPVNKCVNGVPCTKEEYQQNRRSVFRIVNK